MSAFPTTIYRLISDHDWRAAEKAGQFMGTAHDVRDGFIHFSAATQLAETAIKHYAGQSNLLLLHVDTRTLQDALKWEASRNDELFPHLYGPLPTRAVWRVDKIPLDEEAGKHLLPPL